MQYLERRPFISCRIGRREQDLNSPKRYGKYKYLVDYTLDGKLEVREDRNTEAWKATRRIIVERDGAAMSIVEECR